MGDNHPDNKIPMLDLKVWVKDKNKIRHQYYEKPVSAKQVLHSRLALSMSSKVAILTSELYRRLVNS